MPPILVPSSAKRITTKILVIAKLNGRKDFTLRGFVCDIIRPSNELTVQNEQLKHKNKVWKLFKIKNEDTRTMSMVSFQCLYFIVNCEHISSFVPIVEFEQANVCWVHIKKTNRKDKIGYIMRYVALFSVGIKFINK